MRGPGSAGAVMGAILLLAACSSAAPTSAPVATAGTPPPIVATPSPLPTASPAPTADLAHPVGIIAIGHSALTGEGTGGTYEAVPSRSWATGTDPAVNSIYLRLVAALPATLGHVSNTAKGGASAAVLVSQAQSALGQAPAPALAIIDTFDNDMVCDNSNVAQVGKWIADGMAQIHNASPNTKILIVGQPGRPSVAFIAELIAHDPSAKAGLTWNDDCTILTADGKINEPGIKKLAASVDAYEAEQARVCATVPNCFTDGGVRKAYIDKIENFSPDYAHFNVLGQAAQAALVWPVVKRILGL